MYIKLWGTLHYQQETWQIFCKEVFYLRVVFSSCRESIYSYTCTFVPGLILLLTKAGICMEACTTHKSIIWLDQDVFFFKSLDYETKSTRACALGCSCPTPIWWRQGSTHCNDSSRYRPPPEGMQSVINIIWYESKVEGLAQPDALSTQCARPCSKRACKSGINGISFHFHH